jgi:hypothetical protein
LFLTIAARTSNYINKLEEHSSKLNQKKVETARAQISRTPLLTPGAGCYKEIQKTHFVRRAETRDKREERKSIK